MATVATEPSTPQERLDAIEAEYAAQKKRERMYESGFDNEADYEQWELLERLRRATLELRSRKNRSDLPTDFPLAA